MDERIHVHINETYGFYEITCDEGFVMTEWDGKDILEYSSAQKIDCPSTKNLEPLYTITDEEDLEYKRQKDEEMRKREEN